MVSYLESEALARSEGAVLENAPAARSEAVRAASRPLVRLAGVSKLFETAAGTVRALDGIDLEVGEGEIFGIIGRSGAGKSTLIRVVNLLERPTTGRVEVDGVVASDLPRDALPAFRQKVSMIFQSFNLLSSRTVFRNVALPLELAGWSAGEIRRAVEPLLALVGLADKRDSYPAKLSGGQKQRAGIARALAHRPKVLLCDEATSALDPETTRSILALLKDINRRLGITIILITHEMEVVKEICDRVAVIDRGRIVEQGSLAEVFLQPRAEVTRSFLQALRPEPALLRDGRLSAEPRPGGEAVLRLRFFGEAAREPVVSDLVQATGVSVNLLQGTLDEIQDQPFGDLVLSTPYLGEAALARVLGYLAERHVTVEVLGYVPAAH